MGFYRKVLLNGKIRKISQSIECYLKDHYPSLYSKGFVRIKSKAKEKLINEILNDIPLLNSEPHYWTIANNKYNTNRKVSIIVPNYNHARFLKKRLDSIYNQTYKNIEVILLDDCSTDNSMQILEEYKKKYSAITKLVPNIKNSGGVFKQWQKGISLATGDLIWIAESDDWCDDNFLYELVKPFDNDTVMLSFAQSSFVQDGSEIYSTQMFLKDVSSLDWNKTFAITAHDLVSDSFCRRNVIVNVSSAVFRNIGKFSNEVIQAWNQYKLCGDWLFYLDLIKGGVVYYTCNTKNYYRIHNQSTSLKVQSTTNYYKEHEGVAEYIVRNYDIDLRKIDQLYEDLRLHLKSFNSQNNDIRLELLFNTKKIKAHSMTRKPNVLMCGFSMTMGGGETYPIYLANVLKEKGIPVTFVDFQFDKDDPNVRGMLNPSIPLLRLKDIGYSSEFISHFSCDILHTQHGVVDELVSDYLSSMKGIKAKQVVTLHGMYEAIDERDLMRLLHKLKGTCSQFIYTAEKNLESFKKTNIISVGSFIKLDNGLLEVKIKPVSRRLLGIEENSFVLCLVSRGIPEKGWKEAIEIISKARKESERDIQLIIIGDGVMYDKLYPNSPDFVHFLGVKSNIRDYFASSDMGFLPSKFKGESYPLVIIDCLFAGRPVLASNLGEIKYQLQTENGLSAGCIFDLEDWVIPINRVSEIVVKLANDKSFYESIKNNVKGARKKFDLSIISDKYLQIYYRCINNK